MLLLGCALICIRSSIAALYAFLVLIPGLLNHLILVWVRVRVVLRVLAVVHKKRDRLLLFRLRFLAFMGWDRFVLLLDVRLIAIIADLLDEPKLTSLICVSTELLAYCGALQQLLVDSNGVEELISINQTLLKRFFTI